MRALTIWQPWASLIAGGVKPFEFRRRPAPRKLVGQRIVIHAAARPNDLDSVKHIRTHLVAGDWTVIGTEDADAVRKAIRMCHEWESGTPAPLAAGLGTVTLGQSHRGTELYRGRIDDGEIDPDIFAWPMLDPVPFDKPIPAVGMQGFWKWSPAKPLDRDAGHLCPAIGCTIIVPNHMFMCARHWRLLPADQRREVYNAYADERGGPRYRMATTKAIETVAKLEGQEA
ncbi:MAG: hypothetical protein ACREEN_08350 [Stellaceae bacterium]